MTTPIRILILEDNPSDAELMIHALVRAGYDPIADRVETEQDFREQLQRMPEIVLADFSVPGFDAMQALEVLRECNLDIPVIIVSIAVGEERAVQVMQRGAFDYVIKDRLGRLGHAVSQALAQKSLRDAKVRAELALRDKEELCRKVQEAQRIEQEARKQAEQDNRVLQTANNQKDEFLAMLGHELRNPLAPIRTAAHVLQQALKDDPKLKRACEIIQRQSVHMTRIIEDLLDISRISRGKIVLRKDLVDLNDLVQRTADDYRGEIEACGETLTVSPHTEPLWITADSTRICQVIGNLLQNSKTFTSRGGHITMQLSAMPDGNWAELVIRDTGIGMTQETVASLFEPFRQADHSIARTAGGLGLGLSMTRGIVEMHGGRVVGTSKGLGMGSEFTIKIPLNSIRKAVHEGPLESTPRRVLIVEDNMDAALMLRLLLEMEGHDVAVASTAAEGLRAAHKQDSEIVLCDIGLPGDMDGYAFARAFRSDPSLRSKTLVAVTGYGLPSDQHRAMAAGFNMHLTKPVEPSVLIELLGSLTAPVAL